MRQTPSKIHMHDMVTIDKVGLEIERRRRRAWGAFKSPPPKK